MYFSIIALAKHCLLFALYLTIFSIGLTSADQSNDNATRGQINIGVIIDADSRSGKEEKISMEIARQFFNCNTSDKDNPGKLFLHFKDSGGDPLRAASAAEELIKEKRVQVLIGMDTWEEAVLVAGVSNKAQVPVISFATPVVSLPFASLRWPFLVRMATNKSAEMVCIAAIVRSYGWQRVIVISEDDSYSSYFTQTALLSDALQDAGAQIEFQLILPPIDSLSNPKEFVHQELKMLRGKAGKVFIVLQSSLALAPFLFREAKQVGLLSKDTAWIVSDSIANFLHSFNSTVMDSMSGVLGIKAYYPKSGPLEDFSNQFIKNFRSEYLDEYRFSPGIYAMRAYDSIKVATQAVVKLDGENDTGTTTPKMLLQNLLSTKFTGLSGQIGFNNMGGLSQPSIFRIVNIIGNGYKELDFWITNYGFSNTHVLQQADKDGKRNGMNEMKGLVTWRGDHRRVPIRRAMFTDKKIMKIGVPSGTTFEMLVKVDAGNVISGFCIDIFKAALGRVEKKYALPYKFIPYNCLYEDLIHLVYNKTIDAVVGDVTILEDRMEYVEFTQPYIESGLSIIMTVNSKSQHKEWIFLKPFTPQMWLVTAGILIWTMFVVWFLEHRWNPHFRGDWNDQLGTALWFTFSSLFFAHRERLYNNFTRMVVVVWLFVVLILTSSYTANLSSMLTVQKLETNVSDINWLRDSNQKVGVDSDSFVRKYLETVLNFTHENILNIEKEIQFPGAFQSHNIKAAILELPEARAFLNQHCTGYTVQNPNYRFGGYGFVFQKGSFIAQDFSKAILSMSKDGSLKKIEDRWFSSTKCYAKNITETESLGLESFWGLFAISGATSTLCLLLFVVKLIMSFRHQQEEVSVIPIDNSMWGKAKRLAHYFHDSKIKTQGIRHVVEEGPDEENGSTVPPPPSPVSEIEIEIHSQELTDESPVLFS